MLFTKTAIEVIRVAIAVINEATSAIILNVLMFILYTFYLILSTSFQGF